MSVTYIDASTLIQWIDDPSSNLCIVDVRDDDFRFGNITGCLNLPVNQFLGNLDDYKKLEKFKRPVFHCALSQVRGPKSATRYSNETGRDAYILKGGFSQFQEQYKGTKYIENLNAEYWLDPY